MKTSFIQQALLLPVLIVLAGCHSGKLYEIRGDLNTAYAQMLREQTAMVLPSNPSKAQKMTAMDAELRYQVARDEINDVADMALEAAKEAESKEDKISFLQKSATAAWVSNDGAKLIAIDSVQGPLCAPADTSFANYPRDCAMLRGIPYFMKNKIAINDLEDVNAATNQVRSLRRDPATASAWVSNTVTVAAFINAESNFNTLHNVTENLFEINEALKATNASDDFKAGFAARTFTVACNVNISLELMRQLTRGRDTLPSAEKTVLELRANTYDAAKKLFDELSNNFSKPPNVANCI